MLTASGGANENFARELFELFVLGEGHYTEADVYAGARVFSGWNLTRPGAAADGTQHYEFVYNSAQHETTAKTFSFPIYSNGSATIPARALRASGAAPIMQAGRAGCHDATVQRPSRSPRR